MVGAMVSASTGALNSLLGKLATLMGKEYGKLKGVSKEVESLADEFSSMKALLERLADVDELDPQAREWRNQVNDMSYDIEDCIDEFIHHLGNNDAAAAGFMKKTARVLKKLRARHQIASKIQEIKFRVKEVSERRLRYRLDEYTAHSCYVPVDPRVVAIYNEAAALVGIDVPTDELVHLLMGEEKELKVASIVGFGGLGKTTLASQVYHKLEGKFQCWAFVSVSQKPDIAKLLNKILLEIGGGTCHTGDLDDLLKTIALHLQDKRYFIVLDDLWDASAWKVIKCALPANDCGSRVLTTTRVYSTASACSSYNQHYVYNMRPLVRSVVAFTRVLLPSFQELKYVRVLLLEFKAAQMHKMDITSVCGLFLLRYLKIVTDCDLELPNQFWGLRYLDTVVLENPMRLFVPSGVVHLSRLLHLIVPCGMVFQDGIGSLKSLRTLQAFDFSRSSLESFRSLRDLTNLRDLRLDYERFDMDDETMDAFHSLLESLSHCSSLKSIVISSLVPHFDWLSTLSGFPRNIRRLHLWGLWFPRIPNWVSQLHDLYSLELVVIEVAPKDDSIDILAGLPSLAHLRLEIKHDREEMIVISGTGVAFPALKHLALVCPKPALAFESGAMPRLHNVDLWLTVSGWGDIIKWLGPIGIKHLPSGLQKIFLCCRGKDADEATLSALRSVFNTHHPGIDLIMR
ncbi:hypothetical protein EJB05_02734 [Eragrostis curvula]|uniref:AAA+ ATPase domain-containing protein n=1 Tax=Eragrostis curvula TaxID=38414 RepID=A0A5J9WT65_9POAL|nr:hypothetical protein EJB05_02734 [Eragrostis curvula]